MIKVEKKKVANYMTCRICDGFYRDATTIQECLHSCEHTTIFPVCFPPFSDLPMKILHLLNLSGILIFVVHGSCDHSFSVHNI